MKSWKYKFLEKVLLGQNTDINNNDSVILKCINISYRDMLTAGRFYIPKDNQICNKFKLLLENYNYIFSHKLIIDTAQLFGDCEKIEKGNNYVTRFGLAQKLVNMTFKYFYVFQDYINKPILFTDCHCPLDSIILNKLQLNVVWSKCSESQYNECQNKINEKLKNISLDKELSLIGNLAYDFLNW